MTTIEEHIKEVEAQIDSCIETMMQQHIIDMDELDKLYTYQCRRCHGKGRIPIYRHVQNGTCFACGGSGRINK